MNKAVMLVRVSTKEQQDNYSLEAQKDNLNKYADKNSFDIVKCFELVESSTKGGRKNFYEMMSWIDSQDETIHLLVDTCDRLQRSFKETGDLSDMVGENKLVIHILKERLVIDSDSDPSIMLTWDMNVLMSKNYVVSLGYNIRRSNQKKLENGEITRQSPVGYINYRDEKGESKVKVDPERYFIVREAFELYASGLYSIGSLWCHLKDRGLTIRKKSGNRLIGRSTVHKMLRNKFYIGIITQKGKDYPHNYKTFVDEGVFYKCQELLNRNKQSNKNEETKYDFVFKGMLKNKETGRLMSGTLTKGNVYYRSPKYGESPASKNIKEENVISQLEDFFNHIQIPEELIQLQLDPLKNKFEKEKDYRISAINKYRKQFQSVDLRKDRLLNLYLEGSINQDVYDKKLYELNSEALKLESKIKDLSKNRNDFVLSLEKLKDICNRLPQLFQKADKVRKRKIVNCLFSNLEMDGDKLHYQAKKPFDIIVDSSKNELWYTR